MKRLIPLALLAYIGCCIGCSPDLGEADPEAAAEIVYDQKGVPAYAGQALVIQSCGAGGFCHAGEIEDLADRHGAPAGLSFDLRLETTNSEVTAEEEQRLVDDHTRVKDMARTIWGQVLSGAMPPGGEAGSAYRMDRIVSYDRLADDGVTFTPLPALEAEDDAEREEARDILRNWLASGAPVIRRAQRNASDEAVPHGQCAPICPRTCVDVTWESIYTQIIRPTCALSRCHDHDDPQGDLDLLGESSFGDAPSLDGALRVRSRLLEHRVTTDECREMGQTTMLEPGNAMGSLFYLKVAPSTAEPPVEVCGGRMPAAGTPLIRQEVCAIEAWINCGACAEEDDELVDPMDPASATCRECLGRERTRCDVAVMNPDAEPPDLRPVLDELGNVTCTATPVCSNVVPPDLEDACPENP